MRKRRPNCRFYYLPRHSLSCLSSIASIAENRGKMPLLSHATAMTGHLAAAVDARSPGRSVSEAFFQAVGDKLWFCQGGILDFFIVVFLGCS
jgi:hypothetical protein